MDTFYKTIDTQNLEEIQMVDLTFTKSDMLGSKNITITIPEKMKNLKFVNIFIDKDVEFDIATLFVKHESNIKFINAPDFVLILEENQKKLKYIDVYDVDTYKCQTRIEEIKTVEIPHLHMFNVLRHLFIKNREF